MSKRISVCGLMLLLTMGLWAQREDTVFDTPFEQLATKPFYSVPIRNIGQSSHLLTVIGSNAPGQTCVSPSNVDTGLEYSYDRVVWIRTSQQVTKLNANDDGVIVGNQNVAGAYPYVRAVVRDFDNVNCRLTGKYSGAVAAFNVNNVAQSNNFLGINAVSTLAGSANGLNVQVTSQPPSIVDVDITSNFTFARSVNDAIKGRWIKGASQQGSRTGPSVASVCAQVTGTTITIGNAITGTYTWTVTGSGTGYTPTSFQCNFSRNDVLPTLNANPFFNVTYDNGDNTFTWVLKTGIGLDGFDGFWFPSTCTSNSTCNLVGFGSAQNSYVTNAYTFYKTQPTGQGLQGCFKLYSSSGNAIGYNIQGYDSTCTVPLTEKLYQITTRGVNVQIWINDYQAFSYVPTVVVTNNTLTGVTWGIGVPFIPQFVGGVTDFIWLWSDNKDNANNFANNWRNDVLASNTVTSGNYGASVMFNGVTSTQSNLTLVTLNPVNTSWVNSSGPPLMDAIVRFQVGGPGGTNSFVGQLWDAVYYGVNQPADTMFNFMGFNWHVFTGNSNNGALMLRWN